MSYFVIQHKITREELHEQAVDILSRHPEYEPVEAIENIKQPICSNWWGKSWCENFERYSMWGDRLTKGKKYLRDGAVINLKINGGNIDGIVLESLSNPYEVHVEIKPILPERQRELERLAAGKIQNLEELLSGNFPEELRGLFFRSGILFPRPDEIDFNCTCNDWANMCRHVAAVLYGVGVRLDRDPLIFFNMRGIDIRGLINNVVQGKIETMLSNMDNDTPRIYRNVNLSELFGMEVASTPALPVYVDTVPAESTDIEVVPEAGQSVSISLEEELLQLQIENAVLKEKLKILTAQAKKAREAIIRLA
ncbi:MAG: hypothetical protein IJQ24_05160 [Synergistaceae bacterium]|nr:hypothetical protein [Synergistaceae bacterium]MBQ6969860.1 hypothetical protein [Synergistaceae bacterium]MBR0185399.1 hypothetical protein [Synergistaceae bacterium]